MNVYGKLYGSLTPQEVIECELVPSRSESEFQTKAKSYTPTETAQSETIMADSGYDGLTSVSVSVGAVASDYIGSAVTRRTSSDLTASATTVTVPSGYYEYDAMKSVDSSALNLEAKTGINPSASSQTITPDGGYDGLSSVQINAISAGTAGTPTATKGSVSNHSITVTPSVTNTTGWITGSTLTGTGVSVSASELVSGNKAIVANGTGIDVADYSTVSVNVASTSATLKTKSASGSLDGTNSTITFTNLSNEPTLFFLEPYYSSSNEAMYGWSQYALLTGARYDGTNTYYEFLYAYLVSNGLAFDIIIPASDTSITWAYSNGSLTITVPYYAINNMSSMPTLIGEMVNNSSGTSAAADFTLYYI